MIEKKRELDNIAAMTMALSLAAHEEAAYHSDRQGKRRDTKPKPSKDRSKAKAARKQNRRRK